MSSQSISKVWINPFSSAWSLEDRLFFLLRFGALGCFVGHGAWGLITKAGWVPFFEIYFISKETAYQLMPLVGIMDILVGVILFFYPNRPILWWALIWTLFTALLRPSAGMGMSEFFERAGNYGVPLAFIYAVGLKKAETGTWNKVRLNALSPLRLKRLELILRWSLVTLMLGHGGLALFAQSPTIMKHLAYLGIETSDLNLRFFGAFEMLLGIVVAWRPRIPYFMLFILGYKLLTESMHPISGGAYDILETIERMGDYVIPVMLFFIYREQAK